MPRVIRVSHIGLATESIEQALGVFGVGMGLPLAGEEEVPGDRVRVAFLPVGGARLELLEPIGDEGPVQKFLANRGPGIHHICFEVDDLPGMLAQLKACGVELIDDQPRRGAHGSTVAFVHPRSANGVLVELVQSGSVEAPYGY